jgi:hypothetical protein
VSVDPTPDMSAGFTIVDHADAGGRSVRRDLDGRYRIGRDRWHVLAKRLPVPYAEIQEIAVTLERRGGRGDTVAPNHAVVVVRHREVRRTITHRYRIGEEWQASKMAINVPEEVIMELSRRTRRGS